MSKPKNARQTAITELIMTQKVSTQDELTSLVRKAGFPATQATISRDIKELGITKQTLPDGTVAYSITDKLINTALCDNDESKIKFKLLVLKILIGRISSQYFTEILHCL